MLIKGGTSKEQVFITTVIDRQSNLIIELACKGELHLIDIW